MFGVDADGKRIRNTEIEKIEKANVAAFEEKAMEVIKDLRVFTWLSFENKYLSNKAANESVTDALENYVTDLREAGRIGTAVSYKCTMRSLNKFSANAKFTELTPATLHIYEKWILDKANNITTIGIYLRLLRTLFNIDINDGALAKDYYPFGRWKYEIPTDKTFKKLFNYQIYN